MSKVVIMGGGVGGLSAAHHLVENGFEVEVYERQEIPGGKARSFYFSGRGGQTLPDPGYPAEHGFRFFPGFYRHVTDTMKNIETFDDGGTVFDNLVATTEMSLARGRFDQLKIPARFPQSLGDFKGLMKLFLDSNIPIPVDEMDFWLERVWQVMTSCQDRRNSEYEQISWWKFIKAGSSSPVYQKYLANLTRTLVAAVPQRASTKTNGDILIQLLMSMFNFGTGIDRVLDGPTNEVWINPWLKQLIDRGVKYYINAEVTEIRCDDKAIVDVVVSAAGKGIRRVTAIDRHGVTATEPVQDSGLVASGDYYVSAVPVERMAKLLYDDTTHQWTDLANLDTSLRKLVTLSRSVSWMNGFLFYLKEDVKLAHGHTIYVDAPWALTSISQPQFWKNVDVSSYGDGKIKGIISVDISDWMDGKADVGGKLKTAINCTPEEIRDVVWRDITNAMNNGPDGPVLTEYHEWFLDPDIEAKLRLLSEVRDEAPPSWTPDDLAEEDLHLLQNTEPLLVNEINTWRLRPDAVTDVPNLFLAADYVRTNTDLATMEGANEAARRSVNGIMEASGIRSRCLLWQLHEPEVFAPFRWYDQRRFNKGLEWNGSLPLPVRIADRIWGVTSKFVRKFKAVS